MKTIITFFLFFTSLTYTYAQIVNIPDANFKNILISEICADTTGDGSVDSDVDTNNNGEIELSEALSVFVLELNGNQISSSEGIQYFTNLKTLLISSNELNSIDLSQNVNLEVLSCTENLLTVLDLTQNINLIDLTCASNNLIDLDVSSNVNLEVIYCDNNQLVNLDVTSSPLLSELNCTGNQLTELDVSANLFLTWLQCSENLLTHLDVSANIQLDTINCQENNLVTLFLKNGRSMVTNFEDNFNLTYICADEFNFGAIAAALFDYGMTGVSVNSYCSFVPGGDFYDLEGLVKFDSNSDGCDTNDMNLAYLNINISDGNLEATFISDATGNYYIPLQEGNYTITPLIENSSYYTFSPSSLEVDFPSDGSPFIQDFCITANGVLNDLEVILIPMSFARPGFESNYKIIYKNKGNTVISGYVEFIYSDNIDVTSYGNAFPSEDSIADGIVTWNYANLQPFESREIDISLNLNTPTDPLFPLNGGDILSYNATIFPVNEDVTPSDNGASLRQEVVNSFDPNDKRCLEGETISPDMVGRYVHYMIRFENTGTANAINVVVKDEIDTSKFDISTLVPLASSHDFVTRIQNTNEVEFIFENIDLPFDDANNDGYVVFKIKTLESLVLGDTFTNDAEIYFDFNAPIITNDFATTVEENLSINDFEFNDSVNVYPNPVSDVLYIASEMRIDSVTIYDINGRTLQNIELSENQSEQVIDLQKLSQGVYLVKLFSEKGESTQKIVKQ